MSGIKRGDLVEFTDYRYRDYPPQEVVMAKWGDSIQFGVALDNENEVGTVEVKMADGTTKYANFVHANGWAGWMPEGLEPIWAEINHEACRED